MLPGFLDRMLPEFASDVRHTPASATILSIRKSQKVVRHDRGSAQHPAAITGCLTVGRPWALPQDKPSLDAAVQGAEQR
jgi:hypothetical protein